MHALTLDSRRPGFRVPAGNRVRVTVTVLAGGRPRDHHDPIRLGPSQSFESARVRGHGDRVGPAPSHLTLAVTAGYQLWPGPERAADFMSYKIKRMRLVEVAFSKRLNLIRSSHSVQEVTIENLCEF